MEQPDLPERPIAKEARASSTPRPAGAPFPVVGLGASAGGLPALQAFFDHMPPESGMAFVIILHLSPEYESQAAELLQAHTMMTVRQVTGPVVIEPDHVYVIPPAKDLLVVDGQLQLADPETGPVRHVPIDHFFRTLAETHERHAMAIILSGTGSDGSIGLKRIKEQGGTIFAQDPQEAEFGGMPRSAIATGLVDYVLPIAAMPEMLITYWRRATQTEPPATEADGPSGDEAVLREVLALLRVPTDHDFSQYKRPTILRRIGRRRMVTGAGDMPTYLELLHSRPEEVQALLQDLLISVTNFFRDREAWSALESIVPLLFARPEGGRAPDKGPGDQVRVWVTACATGEEAYSVAMLLQEHADTLEHTPAIQVFATDIDDEAIRHARHGEYPETIAGDVSPERLRRFFVLEGGRYRVKQELRDLVLFAHHNVLRDPPFSRLDLITCRNLLIYLNREAQDRVLRLFHFSLRPAGYLLLGSAETLDGVPGLFDVVAKGQRLFKQRPNPAVLPPPISGPAAMARPRGGAGTTSRADRLSLAELHQRLALAHAQPSMIVNADYDIVYLSPGAGRFLTFEPGEPSVNLLRAAHPDLRIELRAALFSAAQQGSRVVSPRVRVAEEDAVRLVDLLVEPVQEGAGPGGLLFVLLRDMGEASGGEATLPDAIMNQLDAELQRTREQLQLTVEEYETAAEEYKAVNEELTAINEELRASTEELETSKEEMQAINEELTTVNQELKHKVEELSQANNDLHNLIAATQIGTLFLDRELRLTRYTPSVEQIFNLIPADINRPLAHITHTLAYEHLAADAARVLANLAPIAREVRSAAGEWYLAQIRPYRTTDERIGGVVITFVDITDRRRAEEALRSSEEQLRFATEAAEIFAWEYDLETQQATYASNAEQVVGFPLPGNLAGLFALAHEDDRQMLAERFARARQDRSKLEAEYRLVDPKTGAIVWQSSHGILVDGTAEKPRRMVGISQNITGRKLAEEERERLLQVAEQARQTAEAALEVRNQFLSIASHELRTPLTPLLGYAGMLRQSMAESAGPPQQRLVAAIDRQVKRLNALIGTLLDAARLQRGQFTMEPRPLDLAALVSQVVDEFGLTLPPDGAGHTITLLGADEALPVLGDATRLEEVLHNLLGNALKYSPAGGTIQVRLSRHEAKALLEVADEGIGIPAEARAHLFEPFYRARNVGRSTSGFGLGLHIAHEIVARHAGRIEVESAEGQGTTVRVVLPLREADA